MPDQPDTSTLNKLGTDVAVLANELQHTNKRLDEITAVLKDLSVVTHGEFEAYKKIVEQDYVKKSDIKGLLFFWNMATSTLGKVIVTAIIAGAIYIAYQTSVITGGIGEK